MFKILSTAAKKISVRNLEAVGKPVNGRCSSSSSSSRKNGLTDYSKKKTCEQKVCRENPSRHPPKKVPESRCDNPDDKKTWRTCPEPSKPAKFSCEGTKPPRAPRKPRLQVASKRACSQPSPSLQAPDCFKVEAQLCPRASMPGCGKARIPPRCEPKKAVRDCVKLMTPFPSFSECYKFPSMPPVRSECTCLTAKKIC